MKKIFRERFNMGCTMELEEDQNVYFGTLQASLWNEVMPNRPITGYRAYGTLDMDCINGNYSALSSFLSYLSNMFGCRVEILNPDLLSSTTLSCCRRAGVNFNDSIYVMVRK